MRSELNKFFNDYIEKESLFKDKKSLQSNFTPSEIKHRDEQINQIAKILAPCLAISTAMLLPMFFPAPVIRAFFPTNSFPVMSSSDGS